MIQNNKKGIALILVISSISMLALMMVEFTFGTRVNLKIAKNFTNAVKGQALARSGVYFALLELNVHKKLKDMPMLKQIPGFDASMLDMIWQFGFIYPPLPSKKGTFGSEKAIKELTTKSHIEGNISVQIKDESSKINLNDLGNEKTKKAIFQQLLNIFEQKKASDEEFFRQYRDLNFSDLINNIIDWIDENRDRETGGDEENYYSRLPIPYKPKNAPLDTVSEVALIEGFDDDVIFNLILSHVTVYPTGGVNVNSADATTLKSISSEFTDEDVAKIIERRQTGGNFKKVQDFEAFCKNQLLKSSNFNKDPIVPLTVSTRIFSLESTAEVHGTMQTIRAIVDTQQVLPNGMPQIIYWNLN